MGRPAHGNHYVRETESEVSACLHAAQQVKQATRSHVTIGIILLYFSFFINMGLLLFWRPRFILI
jgi:hypothetical protein